MLFCLGFSLTCLSYAFAADEDAGVVNPEETSVGKTEDQFAKAGFLKNFSGEIDALAKASKPKK